MFESLSRVLLLHNTQGHWDPTGDLYVCVCVRVCAEWEHNSLSRWNLKIYCALPRLRPHCSIHHKLLYVNEILFKVRYWLSLATHIIIEAVQGTGLQDRQGLAVQQSALEVFDGRAVQPVKHSLDQAFHFCSRLHLGQDEFLSMRSEYSASKTQDKKPKTQHWKVQLWNRS